MSDVDWVAAGTGLLGSLVTAAGVFYAAGQLKQNADEHKAAERWRRTEYASRLVERLATEEDLSFCARALDWAVGPLIIPSKYKVLFPADQATIDHGWGKLARAVRPDLDPEGLEPEFLLYRYCFDSFGAYLETIARHLKLGTVEKEHLVGLGYFLNILVSADYYKFLPDSEKIFGITEKDVFTDFFETFYPEVVPLLNEVGSFPGAPPPSRVRQRDNGKEQVVAAEGARISSAATSRS